MATGLGALADAQGIASQLARTTVAFDGTAGGGEAGTAIVLFRVTGAVRALVIGVCTESLTVSDGATVEVGTTANPATIIAQTLASSIDVGEVWVDNTPNVIYCWTTAFGCMIGDGADIELMPRTANVTDGTLVFTCFWTPLTDTGEVLGI
jgi:hypothetical protein